MIEECTQIIRDSGDGNGIRSDNTERTWFVTGIKTGGTKRRRGSISKEVFRQSLVQYLRCGDDFCETAEK